MRWRGAGRCAARAKMSDGKALGPVLGQALLAFARSVLPAGVAVAWADPAAIWPPDAQAPLGAVPRRQAEFAAGRHAARAAFVQLGQPAPPLPMAPDRAPVWPAGWTGSISHSATACLAAVGPAGLLAGIGLDLEPAEPIEPDLWPSLLCPAERATLDALAPPDRGLWVTRIFSAKEAAFKAQFARSRAVFGFEVLQITAQGRGFTAEFREAVAPFAQGDRLTGYQAVLEGHILSVVLLPT